MALSSAQPYLCCVIRLRAIQQILQWEWALEYRRSNGWFLPLLFAAMVGYLCSLLVREPSPTVWLALLWMTMVFSALQTALRSFAATPGQWLYLNQLVAPTELLVGKTITTALNCLLVTWTGLALFSLWLGWPHLPEEMGQVPLWPFILSLSLGAVAISSTLSFTAALASKIERGTGIMAILSLPLLLPTLLIAMRASKLALLGTPIAELYPNWAGEILMAGLPLALGGLLFPYLWRS